MPSVMASPVVVRLIDSTFWPMQCQDRSPMAGVQQWLLGRPLHQVVDGVGARAEMRGRGSLAKLVLG